MKERTIGSESVVEAGVACRGRRVPLFFWWRVVGLRRVGFQAIRVRRVVVLGYYCRVAAALARYA